MASIFFRRRVKAGSIRFEGNPSLISMDFAFQLKQLQYLLVESLICTAHLQI
ncbi:conserved hypothetical protein [Ricinus communis]|uniref:Uncharacterized protein n=1 Tax=Ricinus communis TaxID=3988 RepID=B9SDE5_RICCO|nr:conserved hypothetical protein [Ricinus communis]